MTRVLPKGWEEKTLGEVCEIVAGQSPESSFYNQEKRGVPFYQGKKEFSSKYINPAITWTNKITKIALANDILMSVRAPVGPVNYATEKCCIGRGLAAIRPKKDLETDFVFYFLQSIEKEIAGHDGTVFNSISRKEIEKISIPVPSLPEQKRIVEKLDKIFADIDKAKENTQKNLANAKEVFAVRLNCILENPKKTWEQRTFAEICDVRDGTHDSPKYLKEGYSLLTSKNLKNGELVFDKIKYISREDYEHINERSKVDIGDVLFAMIGTIGNPVVVTEEPNYAIKNMALFKYSKQLNPFFLKYLLESNLILNKMQKEANGTTQKFVSLGYLRKFPILLPPTEEQEQIVAELDSLRAKAQELKQIYTKKLADLDELKQSVLQQAFSGKL